MNFQKIVYVKSYRVFYNVNFPFPTIACETEGIVRFKLCVCLHCTRLVVWKVRNRISYLTHTLFHMLLLILVFYQYLSFLICFMNY